MKQTLQKLSICNSSGTSLTTAVVTVLLLALPGTPFAADMRGQILANPCAGCHGTDGASPGSIPTLNDLDSNDIRQAMRAFKADTRSGSIMNRIAKGYTDEEIDLISKQFK